MLKTFSCSLLFVVFYLLGDMIAYQLSLPISGAITGLILLLLCQFAYKPLALSLAQPSQPILANMTLFFIPALVGVIAYGALFVTHWQALVLAIVISTLLCLGIVAWLTQRLLND